MRDKPIRIVHIIEPFQGGTAKHVCLILPELVRRGFDVTLICSLNRADPKVQKNIAQLTQIGIKVRIMEMCREIRPLTDLRSFLHIFRLLQSDDFAIVHTHCSKAGVLGRIAALLASKPVRIHTPHCFAFIRCNSRLRRFLLLTIERFLGRFTTKLVAVSPAQAKVALRYHIVGQQRCVAINNGLPQKPSFTPAEPTEAKVSFGLGPNTLVVTTACRLVHYKGVFRFLRAAALSRAPNAVFLLAGDGKLSAEVEEFIGANNLGRKVKLLGHVWDMDTLYAASDIIALCSDAEAQPYVLLEAMQAKCPIVATRVIGNMQLISHGQTGILAETNPSAIAAAIDDLLADETKRNEYAQEAYAYFCANHTLEQQICELTQTYTSCIRTEKNCYETERTLL